MAALDVFEEMGLPPAELARIFKSDGLKPEEVTAYHQLGSCSAYDEESWRQLAKLAEKQIWFYRHHGTPEGYLRAIYLPDGRVLKMAARWLMEADELRVYGCNYISPDNTHVTVGRRLNHQNSYGIGLVQLGHEIVEQPGAVVFLQECFEAMDLSPANLVAVFGLAEDREPDGDVSWDDLDSFDIKDSDRWRLLAQTIRKRIVVVHFRPKDERGQILALYHPDGSFTELDPQVFDLEGEADRETGEVAVAAV